MVGWVAKSRVLNRWIVKIPIWVRSDRVGIPKSRIQVPKKSGILSGNVHFLFQILCFVSYGRVWDLGLGRVGYIPDQEKSGSGCPKKFGFGSGTRSTTMCIHLILHSLFNSECIV